MPKGVVVRGVFSWLLLAFAGLLALRSYASAIAAGGASYQSADWLINYSSGFIRRGLFGSIYAALFPDGQAGLWMLFAVQIAIAAVTATYGLRWLHRSRYSWAAITLACGPAALAFIGWDPGAFARKESLGLAALTLVAIGTKLERVVARRTLTIFALLLFVVAVFSWEGNGLLLPAVLFLLSRRSDVESRAYAVFAVLIAVLGLVASVLFPGLPGSSDVVCDSLRDKGLERPELCGGAIAYLGADGMQMVRMVKSYFPLYLGYLPLFALSMLPMLRTRWIRRRRLLALASAIALAPLFIIAVDYGRWISLLVMVLLICLMSDGPLHETDVEANHWTPFAAVAYLTVWGLPHWLSPNTTSWPWLGTLHDATRVLIRVSESRWLWLALAIGAVLLAGGLLNVARKAKVSAKAKLPEPAELT